VLGAILQKTSGKPFRELLAERVVRPLGATNIRVATSGMPGVRGYTSAGTIEPAANLATWGPGGAIVGTARDLLAFDRALLARSIVSEPSTKLMWTGEPRLGYVALGAWSFPAPLAGCSKPVALVERRGAIGGVQVRNVLAPAIGRALIVFTNSEAVDFGEVWQGKGLSHALLSAAFCDG
jgi:CubicO group peptidase (beta-lactamase class C family)